MLLVMFVALCLLMVGQLGILILTSSSNMIAPSSSKIMIAPSSANIIAPPKWLKTNDVTYSKSLPRTDGSSSLLMIFPHSHSEQENKTLQELAANDKRAVLKLIEFLNLEKEFDGATCLQHPSTQNRRRQHETGDESKTAGKTSLQSSWCRFNAKKWSVIIRNTGPVQKVKLRKLLGNEFSATENSTLEEEILLQNCNILQGPFVMRKNVFDKIGGLIKYFGKVTLLEFFLRSKGELRMAKLTNCAWTRELTRADRGNLEGANFAEYASFGNKHKILRIVTENRIEWTACVANWKLCPEKPYTKPRGLPGIAAPICCSVVLGQMLVDFTRALDKLGIKYRLVYGTLLGAVRSQAIIPWTYDVDIAIPKSAYKNQSTFAVLQNELGGKYYVGKSFGNMPRAHMLMPPYYEVNTAAFFDGPDDLEGNALFSREIERAVRGMLPISGLWRSHVYVDFYKGRSAWMKDFSFVTINNQTYATMKKVDYELTKWYGENYLEAIVKKKWAGLKSKGGACIGKCLKRKQRK